MVDLDQAKYFVDVADSVVSPKNESRAAIEVDHVEDGDEKPGLQSLGWVVYHHDRDRDEDQTSNKEVGEVEDVGIQPGQMNTFEELSILG